MAISEHPNGPGGPPEEPPEEPEDDQYVFTEPRVETTARGAGYYRVYSDGAQVSQHTTEREAAKAAVNAKLANPDAAVYYSHDYEVDVTINAIDITMKAVSGGTLTQPDDVPNQFTFIDQTDVLLNTLIESAPIIVSGMDSFATADISVDIGEYSINAAAWTATAGTVGEGDSVRVRHTSSGTESTTTNQVLTINGIQDTFSLTTEAPAGGPVLFEDDFANQFPINLTGSKRFDGDPDPVVTLPDWDYQYDDNANPTNPSAAIISPGIFKAWDESRGDPNSWKSELQLAKYFPTQRPELWCQFDIRFNPAANVAVMSAAKIFRMGAYNPSVADGTTGTSVFRTSLGTFAGETTGGMFFYDVQFHNSRWRHKISWRVNPNYQDPRGSSFQRTWYDILDDQGQRFPNDDQWNAPNIYGDGSWHTIQFGMKQNSAPGADDGEIYMYYDGVLQFSDTTRRWRFADADAWVTGLNMITIGGNAENLWAGNIDNSSSPEQEWFEMRNVKMNDSIIT